jgi:hypothetical protein
MIVVRNVFRLKFGKAREMKDLWNEWKQLGPDITGLRGYRVLFDVTGESYTFVLENDFDDLASFEQGSQVLFNNPAWRTFYAKVTPLVESGYREIFSVVDQGTADTMTRAAAGATLQPA